MYKKLLLSFSLIIFWLHVQGQSTSYHSKNYTTQNGLPQNSVKDIKEDQWGFIWLTTEMGLVRFDGENFKVFGTHNTPGLRTDRMQVISTDRNGALYAHESGPAIMRITIPEKHYAPVPIVIGDWSYDLPKTGYGPIPESVFRPENSPLLWKRINTSKMNLRDPLFIGLTPQQVYIESEHELIYIKDKKASVISQKDSSIHQLTLVDDLLVKISKNNKIKVWRDGALQTAFTKIEGSLSEDIAFAKGDSRVFWSKNGTFIYSSQHLHRLHLRNNRLSSEIVLQNLDIPEMISLHYSKEKNIYFMGSEIRGMFVIKPSAFNYPSVPQGTASEIFYSQIKVRQSEIFARNILFSQNGKAAATPELTRRESATYYIDRHSLLYYERFMKLYSYDFKTKTEKKIADLDSRLISIIENPKDSSLFVFTALYAGILHKGSFKYWVKTHHASSKVVLLKNNQFLLCTQHGLKWYNLQKNLVTNSILDSMSIRTAYQDQNNRLWISGYGKGFYLYADKKLHVMPLDKKRALANVHSFIDEQPGYFWLPTNDGLFRVAKKELIDYSRGLSDNIYYYLFNHTDGLRTNEFNGGCEPSYVKLDDGMLSLPSLEGLVWYYPNRVKPVFPDKNIHIDYISVNEKQIKAAKNIILPADFSSFELALASPFFGNTENMILEYRITDLKNSWSRVPAGGIITLNNIRSGKYNIMLRKPNGIPSAYDSFNLDFTVRPFFYNTIWFYLMLFILAVTVVYFFLRYRLSSLKKQSEDLEKIVLSRTKELAKTVSQLTASQLALQESNSVKEKMMALVLHDLRSPIRFLNFISNHLSKNYLVFTPQDLKKSTDELRDSTTALNNFVEQFFNWASSRQENFQIQKTRVPVDLLFNEIKELYQQIAQNSNNDIVVDPTAIACFTDKYILSTILRNLVDNANKNMNNGIITLSAKSEDNKTIFDVSDTGPGMSAEQITQISQENLAGTGIGFIIIYDLLKKIGAQMQIKSTPGLGSVFTITVSAHQVHHAV